jgi:Intron-binding protein aquarius N-terminus
MRDLMNEQTIVPPWLHDTFLGYGDPAAAQYTRLPDFRRSVDFKVISLETTSRACHHNWCWWLCNPMLHRYQVHRFADHLQLSFIFICSSVSRGKAARSIAANEAPPAQHRTLTV